VNWTSLSESRVSIFAQARITRPGMDRDDSRGTYCALRGQRGNANVRAYGEFAAQNRPERLEPVADAFVLSCVA
jgi:hypothetical protein